MSTDRPDTTESPFTVDAGRFQLETEIAAWERDRSASAYQLMEVNFKFGLDPLTDVQLVVPFWARSAEGQEGLGDLTVRVKRNLWGNEGGRTSLGLMPFVTIPTAASGLGSRQVEGGVIVAFAMEGLAGWEWGAMTQVDLRSRDDGTQGWGGVVSAVASRDLNEDWSFFAELAVDAAEHEAPQWTAHVGLVWSPVATWHWDGGIRLGLNDAAPDVIPFLGFARKF